MTLTKKFFGVLSLVLFLSPKVDVQAHTTEQTATEQTSTRQQKSHQESLDKIAIINNTPLRRGFIGNPGYMNLIYPTYSYEEPGMEVKIYFDEGSRIRKFINFTCTKTDCLSVTGYYDTDGDLLHLIYENTYWDKSDIKEGELIVTESGYLYANNGEPTQEECKVFFNNDNKLVTYYASANELTKSRRKGSFNINAYKNTKNLLKEIELDSTQLAKTANLPKVIFDQKKGVSFITKNDVKLQAQPSDTVTIYDKDQSFDAGLKVLIDSDEAPINNWYKVYDLYTDRKGYIFGEFLEPTERSLEVKIKDVSN